MKRQARAQETVFLARGFAALALKSAVYRWIPPILRGTQISDGLYERLQMHFCRSAEASLAPLRAYQVALRRAVLAAGGTATGSHAQRRTSAVELKNLKYREHLNAGRTTQAARKQAVEDTVEHLGHTRTRRDLADAYLG